MEIRCSNLARPMVCAGSLFFTDLPPNEPNPAAEEGTAAGEYLERLLLKQDLPPSARNGVPFTDDMRFYVTPIAEEILSKADAEVLCEQRIDWQTRSGIFIRGSYDISFISNGNLHISDLKFGWGLVEVKENWQLLGYAIGEVMRRGMAFPKIILTIHQPRPHHEDGPDRVWELTYEELIHYKEKIEARMEQIAGGYRDLVTGDKCRYCPAAGAHCTAFNRMFYRGIEVSSQFTQDHINDQELSFQLDLVARASEVIKIKSDSLKQLAVSRLKSGTIIPNYISEASYGDRSWRSGVNPETIKAITGKDIIKKEMLSPAQAEKMGVPREMIDSLADRRFIGQKLKRCDGSAIGNKIFKTTKQGELK